MTTSEVEMSDAELDAELMEACRFTTIAEVASRLGITQQSVSRRLLSIERREAFALLELWIEWINDDESALPSFQLVEDTEKLIGAKRRSGKRPARAEQETK